ncbi:LCP family protein [Kallipyga massiliensis]|uniref:LCP family protein n=1 Tax=Kallipyga massiliensis TaxID=1472764 RepID=UPI0026F30A58|nr:LCP family protein [Kallipyga massiliensis]
MKKFISGFLGVLFLVAMIVFAAILQYFNLLVFWQRIVLLLLFLILGILAYHGIKHRNHLTSVVSILILVMVISFSSVSSYSIVSLYSTLGRMSTAGQGEKEVSVDQKEVEGHIMEGFNVYISGIDTYGPLETESRSDVNMIVSVNPKTGQGFITTIPRDAYVRIADGGHDQYDKLTHAGNYGVYSSIHTLENLFDIKIPYYARVNFDSLIRIVDALGGIEIYNPNAFSVKDVHFDEGMITLDGESALVYARDRKHQAGGELERGRNHVVLLKAIIDKCLSPAILANAQELLNIMAEDVQTNMPAALLTQLINNQLSSGTHWNFGSAQVEGEGRMDLPSYAMPHNQLFMYQLDPDSVESIGNQIRRLSPSNEAGESGLSREESPQ